MFRLITALAIAISVGFGMSYYALTDGRLFAAVKAGAWAAWPDVGQPVPDPYTRAFLARDGSLQLGDAEGVAFTAQTDDAGEMLLASCQYRVAGLVPGATFWTLQATDDDGSSIAAGPISYIHSERIARRDDGAMEVHIGPDLAPENWFPIEGTGTFKLILTLYDAAVFSGGNNTIETMPSITRVGCA